MADNLYAVVAHARSVDALTRSHLLEHWRREPVAGSVVIETCHRAERYASGTAPEIVDATDPATTGVAVLTERDLARHAVRLAIGLESSIVGEDQVLHQLRQAVQLARTRGDLEPRLDRLFEIALRAGRVARSWLPRRRQNLAELALSRVGGSDAIERVLIVGAGRMARLAAVAVSARGWHAVVASRTPERAAVLAADIHAATAPFDPGPDAVATFQGTVIALRGTWPLAPRSREALESSSGWVIDLSAPPALGQSTSDALGGRLINIDDLAKSVGPDIGMETLSPSLVRRLESLADETLADYDGWMAHEAQRAAAAALSERADAAQSAALQRLWGRVALDERERAEVEQMAKHLAETLLRDPIERLAEDSDGRQARAARELFRL